MSTYGPVQLPAFFSSSADFRTWAQGVHNALQAIGLVQTADTGQINLATVALPGGVNTAAGYEIWRLNDSLQATAPFFFKIEYGTGPALDRAGFYLTIGGGSNGSGTLTAPTSARQGYGVAGSKSAGQTLPIYASGDGSRFAVCVGADPASNTFPMWLVCERTRDANGNYTADGLLACGLSQNSSFVAVPAGSAATNLPVRNLIVPLLPACGAGSGSVHQAGSNTAVGTLVYFLGSPFYGASLVDVARPDVGNVVGGQFTATVLGIPHTYLALLAAGMANYLGSVDATADYIGMLWE